MLRESKILRKAWTASVSFDLFVYFLAISITCDQSLGIIIYDSYPVAICVFGVREHWSYVEARGDS